MIFVTGGDQGYVVASDGAHQVETSMPGKGTRDKDKLIIPIFSIIN